MDLTLTKKKENPLLGRTEVGGVVKFEGATPSNAQVTEALAGYFKTDAGNVVLRHVYTKYSKHEAFIEGVVYSTSEARKKSERATPQQKKKLEEERKKMEEEQKKAKEEAKKKETEAVAKATE